MVRNIIVNEGNPFFPIGNKAVLGSMGVGTYGRGSSFRDFVMLPWDLLVTNTFGKNLYDYTIGKLFYVQAALALGTAAVYWRQLKGYIKKRNFFLLMAFAFAFGCIWFEGSQQLRFLVPSLVILEMLLLSLCLRAKNAAPLLMVTALSFFSALPVHGNTLMVALGLTPHRFVDSYQAAAICFARAGVPENATLGIPWRDGILGFFDFDFTFLPPNPYAVHTELVMPPWIYGAAEYKGYEPWPAHNPCMLKKLSM
ncbi:MAG: hypothetical protein EOP06_29865 [Proteobacteria bacterium]|nr:MAG: hypothetical protein EOP06_29865 [Pseudomonadota bacterium]